MGRKGRSGASMEEDLLLSQEGGHRVRPQDFCPGGCVAQLELAGGAGKARR